MELSGAALVATGAFFAGAMNAMAGGGTFFSFPALLAAGVPPVTASASNTVALWPASLSSAWAYRREALRHRRWALILIGVSLIGGIAGGLLLLAVSNATFATLIPWLLLLATVLFAFAGKVSLLIGGIKQRLGLTADSTPGSPGGALFQLAVATYGGFFGAGLGILTLAALAIQGFDDIQELNALKNLASAVNYTVAALTFIVAGAISWPHTLVMLTTATVGGYLGAAIARRLPAHWLKRFVVLVGSLLTLIYFGKTYF